MKIVVLGSGRQGCVAAQDLARAGHRVTVVDASKRNLKRIAKIKNIKTLQLDVKRSRVLVKTMSKFDIVLGALPSALGFYSMKCAIDAGVDMVDMSYLPQDPFLLDRAARKKRIKIVPDAGFAPGLSNVLIGEAYQELGKIDRLTILVGGLPQTPRPPFNYRITWSPADLIEEYTRPARIVKKFKTVVLEALTGIEEFTVPKIGRLECFYTDGLRTLLRTMPFVRDMEEKTIRYPGHAYLVKALIAAGFFSDEKVMFEGNFMKPKDFSLELLKRVLSQGDERDLSILIIDIKTKKGMRKYTCIDYYDEEKKITSMARMTAYTGSIITQCLKRYPGYGVVPPEYLGMNKTITHFIKRELKKRHIMINVQQTNSCTKVRKLYVNIKPLRTTS